MILWAAALAFGAARIPPVDQCRGESSFDSFRSGLARIVERRDSKALLAVLSDQVMVDFENSSGPREFARVWKLTGNHARQSPVWRELALVMRLGCARADRARVMPSLVIQLSDQDALEKFLALPRAQLRQAPTENARVVARLNFHVVTRQESSAPNGWWRVALSNGRSGYLRESEIRTALQYRAQFEKIGPRWRLVSFVEGD